MLGFENGNATIYNTAGQKIYTGRFSEKGKLIVTVKEWAAGMYMCKLQGNGKQIIKKLIVAH